MPKLVMIQGTQSKEVTFTGTPLVDEILREQGINISRPCGGHGICGKCAVHVWGNLSPITEREKSLKEGMRLSCQTRLLGDAWVELVQTDMQNIQLEGHLPAFNLDPMEGHIAAAVDIGTTTLAVRVMNLKTGEVLGACARENPQRDVAGNVIGRMEAAMAGEGEKLKNSVCQAVDSMIFELCQTLGIPRPDIAVMTGNTTMLYLLTGRNPEPLSHAPFEADCLYDLWEEKDGMKIYYPPCMSAFVGADITCAVLACQMTKKDETSVLIDVGTNGEIALWHDGKLTVSATAAGPAFEGEGIHKGCGSIPGAVEKVWIEDGTVKYSTIGNAPAVGICGSGLIDAVAAFLETEDIDETGAVEEDELVIAPHVELLPQDVRSIQLAKGAIAAGVQTLLEERGLTVDDVDKMYLAGGFGSHINLENAGKIGLIPSEWVDKTQVMGNAALSGTQMLLLCRKFMEEAKEIAHMSSTVNLGGNPKFTENFMECMMFE